MDMPNVKGKKRSKTSPKRFPRYPSGNDVGKALERIWRLPHFRVHAGRKSTDFTFQLPFSIPKKLESRNLAVYCRLFPDGHDDWASVLVKAYQTTQHRGKPLKNEIGLLLAKILAQASTTLFDKHKDLFQQDPSTSAEEQKSLRRRLIRTGPRLDERKLSKTAIRIALRFRELLPQVREIREFIKKRQKIVNELDLRTAIADTFHYTWVKFVTNGAVLQHLLPIPGHDSRIETLAIESWTPRQLRVGIIYCEELASHPKARLGPTTIYEEYILPGNALILNKR
jgi:hypothetical protein